MVDFGDDGRARRHRPDRRLAERQARPAAPRAVDRRRRRADDGRRRLRLRLRPRPRRGVARASAAEARSSNDEPLDAPMPERRRRDGQLEVVAIESADPRWLAAVAPTRSSTSPASRARDRLDRRSRSARSRRRASTGWPTLRPLPRGRRRRRRSSSSARAAAWSRSPRWTSRSPRRSTSSRARPSSPRARPRRSSALATLPTPTRADGAMIDWDLAERVGAAIAGRRGRPTASRRCRATSTRCRADRARARRRLRAAAARARAAGARGRRPQRLAAGQPRRRCAARSTRCVERSAGGSGPLAGPLRAAGGALLAAEIGGVVGFMSRHVLGQYELVAARPRRRRRGCCSSRRTCARRPARMDVDARATCSRGSSSTRSPTPCSSRACRGCATHLAGLLRELLASVEVKVDADRAAASCRRADDLRGLWDQVRDGGLVTAVAGPERKALHRPPAGDDGGGRGPRRARHGRRRRAGAARRRRAARRRSTPPPRAPADVQAARAAARPRAEAAPVRGRASASATASSRAAASTR